MAHRIDHPTALANMHGQGKPGFSGGDPINKIPATRLTPDWTNDVQENICRVIEGAGMELVKGDGSQLATAIASMVQAGAQAVMIRPAAFAPDVADGKPVRWDAAANRFALAVADGTANNLALGIADVTNASVVCFGKTRAGLVAGLTAGGRHYLSAAAAGGLVNAAPNDVVVMGMGLAADVLFVDIDVGAAGVYDLHFVAGVSASGAGKDLAVQTYAGPYVVARPFIVYGDVGRIGLAPTGAAALGDLKKNGASIYAAKPGVAATTGAFTAGTLITNPTTFAVGDTFEFSVSQVGSTIRGQRFSMTFLARLL